MSDQPERVDLDQVQAIYESVALIPGYDGIGSRVLMDAHTYAVIIRQSDLQRLLAAMAAELRAGRQFEEHIRRAASIDSTGYIRDLVATYDQATGASA